MLNEMEAGTEAGHVVTHRTHLADLRNTESELQGSVEQQQTAVARAEGELESSSSITRWRTPTTTCTA
jgi:hypothetical protein